MRFSCIKDASKVRIKVAYDANARVWIATSPDVAGLVLEGRTFNALMRKVGRATTDFIDGGK